MQFIIGIPTNKLGIKNLNTVMTFTCRSRRNYVKCSCTYTTSIEAYVDDNNTHKTDQNLRTERVDDHLYFFIRAHKKNTNKRILVTGRVKTMLYSIYIDTFRFMVAGENLVIYKK